MIQDAANEIQEAPKLKGFWALWSDLDGTKSRDGACDWDRTSDRSRVKRVLYR